MSRTRPTPAEWEILQVLWKLGPSTVRDVHETIAAARPGHYNTTLKLMQILAEKKLVERDETARAHLYKAAVAREEMQADAAEELMERVFGGSAAELMQRALSRRKPKKSELKELRRMIEEWEAKKR
jgi:predicted transcriptional regulator